jgi:hypothetical protein
MYVVCMKKHVFWYTSKWTCVCIIRQISILWSMLGETVRQSKDCSSITNVRTDRSWSLANHSASKLTHLWSILSSISPCFQVHCAVCRVSLTRLVVNKRLVSLVEFLGQVTVIRCRLSALLYVCSSFSSRDWDKLLGSQRIKITFRVSTSPNRTCVPCL